MKAVLAAAIVLASIVPACAQQARGRVVQPNQGPPVEMQVLGQMLNECGGREATALVRAATAEQQVAALQQQLAAQTKRADDAEAKLPKPAEEKPAAGKPALTSPPQVDPEAPKP